MTKKTDAKLTREKSTNKRVELIVMTAIECFAEKGFHQTSIRDIASRAGISLGNLYNHFSGKDALISAIANLEAIDQMELEAVLLNGKTPLLAIEQFVQVYLRQVSDPISAALTFEIAAEAMRNPAIAKGFSTNRQRIQSQLSQVIGTGMKLGQVDSKLNKNEVAELIIDMVEGLGLRSAFEHRKVSRKSRAVLQSMIQKMLLP